MNTQEFNWTVPADGKLFFARLWSPSGTPRAVVVLVHGLGEHCGRYAHVAEAFTNAGFAMLGFDLRGHGQTPGPRGHFSSYSVVADDITFFVDEARNRFPGLPVFLYGHSLGGALVLYTALNRRLDLAGLVVTSPGLATGTPVAPGKLALARLMSKIAPTFTLPNGLDLNNLSRDPQVSVVYQADPLVHDKISARLGLELIENGPRILAKAPDLSYPTLLMVGGADHLVDPGAVRRFAETAPAGRMTFRLWEGEYHELHNETNRAETIQTMVDWIAAHLHPVSE
jgi:alpha-beta hydrolase superfamily lysophospholipase